MLINAATSPLLPISKFFESDDMALFTAPGPQAQLGVWGQDYHHMAHRAGAQSSVWDWGCRCYWVLRAMDLVQSLELGVYTKIGPELQPEVSNGSSPSATHPAHEVKR